MTPTHTSTPLSSRAAPHCRCGVPCLHHGGLAHIGRPSAASVEAVQTSGGGSGSGEHGWHGASAPSIDRSSSLSLSLSNIRDTLIKLEDTIIFSLIARSEFKSNDLAYQSGGIQVPGFCREGKRYSLMEWILFETEQTHGKIRRYTSPDELAFFKDELPPLVLPPLQFPDVLAPYSDSIDYNPKIMQMYLHKVIPSITQPGDDNNYGSTCLLDVNLLQSLSKRIHYGKFVAEAKFLAQTEEYTKLIKAQDADGIMALLTDLPQEKRVIDRVRRKASVFGQDMDAHIDDPDDIILKVNPSAVADLYKNHIMPLTKDVEVDYLLRRLEWEKR